MDTANFTEVLEETFAKSTGILNAKAKEYASDFDRLRNFKVSAVMRNCTPIQANSGMMVKHTTSVYEMMESGNDFELAQWDEKIIDHINYLILLRALVIEREQEKVKTEVSSAQ